MKKSKLDKKIEIFLNKRIDKLIELEALARAIDDQCRQLRTGSETNIIEIPSGLWCEFIMVSRELRDDDHKL